MGESFHSAESLLIGHIGEIHGPLPQKWLQLYEMLPDKTRKGGGWEPSLPMILGAWSDTPALSKILRLREHIQWAADHGCLDQIFSFLRDVPDDQWHHIGD